MGVWEKWVFLTIGQGKSGNSQGIVRGILIHVLGMNPVCIILWFCKLRHGLEYYFGLPYLSGNISFI